MAMICNKPKGSCRSCVHYRYDGDGKRFSCFARTDFAALFGKAPRTIPAGDTFKVRVDWDSDGKDGLPEIVEISITELHKPGCEFEEDSIGNYLSDEYGFCVNSYEII